MSLGDTSPEVAPGAGQGGPHGGGFTTGIDTAADLQRLPPAHAGGIWTNEIEWLAGTLGRDRQR